MPCWPAERSRGLGTETAPSTSGFRHACRAACLGSLPCRLGIPFILVCITLTPKAPTKTRLHCAEALCTHVARDGLCPEELTA